MSGKTVEFIFDFSAPNGYLAWYPLKDITARTGARIAITPIYLGGMHKLTGNSPPMMRDADVKGKVEYARLEFDRFVKKHGMTQSDAAQLGFGGEIYRKLLHLLAMAYPIGYVVLDRSMALPILVALSLIALTLDVFRSRNSAVHSFFDTVFGFMMRRSERDVLGSGPVFNGATWVTVSFTLLVVLFNIEVAIASFTMFMLGDAAAALFGRRFGKTPWARKGCTVEGSVAFAVIGFAAGMLLCSVPVASPVIDISPFNLAVAVLVAAAVEAAPVPVNDNITAPFGAAIVLSLLLAIGA